MCTGTLWLFLSLSCSFLRYDSANSYSFHKIPFGPFLSPIYSLSMIVFQFYSSNTTHFVNTSFVVPLLHDVKNKVDRKEIMWFKGNFPCEPTTLTNCNNKFGCCEICFSYVKKEKFLFVSWNVLQHVLGGYLCSVDDIRSSYMTYNVHTQTRNELVFGSGNYYYSTCFCRRFFCAFTLSVMELRLLG